MSKKDTDSEKTLDAFICVVCFIILLILSIRGCFGSRENYDDGKETIQIYESN